jgi:hypothetical protein
VKDVSSTEKENRGLFEKNFVLFINSIVVTVLEPFERCWVYAVRVKKSSN